MKFSFGFLAIAAVISLGCGKKTESTEAPTTGLKELKIVDTKVGDGEAIKSGDVASVIYTGKLLNGKVFDSNIGKAPISFGIGVHQVIEGWDQGLIGMKIGGKRHLEVPWKMAYGDRAKGAIPAYSDLYFDIELKDISKPGEANKIVLTPIKEGTGPKIKIGDRVSIHAIFKVGERVIQDSHTDKSVGVTEFTVGNEDEAIPAINESVQQMQEGGKYLLVLPPGFGPPKAMQESQPTESWKVEIEVVKVKRK